MHRRPSTHESGSILVVTLFLTLLMGIFLYSYLNLVRGQRTTVARSQAWNNSLAMAEAGVEEALAQLNPGPPLPVALDRAANGWGNPAGGIYGPKTRTLSGGSYSVCYTTNLRPLIYATGYVRLPAVSATITRVVRAGTTNVPLFTLAMAAKEDLNFNGNNAITDSFNSSNTNLVGGVYNSAYAGSNGTIASLGGVVNVGNADIHGNVLLGANATDSIQNNGLVTGTIQTDFNVDFPDVALPQTTWLPATASPMTINGVSYQYVFGYGAPVSGDYSISSLGGSVYVGTNSSIRLLLSGNASPANIRVAGPGSNAGHLVIYMDGASFTLSGSSVVDGAVANNLNYFGTTNNTTMTFSGNSSFIGTIYAPEADLTLGGGGSSPLNFCGSTITKNVTVNGHFSFHFDEALLDNGPARAYLCKDWTEL